MLRLFASTPLLVSACFAPGGSNGVADAPAMIDASIGPVIDADPTAPDAPVDAIPADAYIGDPALVRAPRNCNSDTPTSTVDSYTSPYLAGTYAPKGFTATHSYGLCTNDPSGPVLSTRVGPVSGQVALGQQPATALLGPLRSLEVNLSYVVEHLVYPGETIPSLAGAVVVSAANGDATSVGFIYDPATGQYGLRAESYDLGVIETHYFGALAPPFRIDATVSFAVGFLFVTATVTTGTSVQTYSMAPEAPNSAFQIYFGVNRYNPDLGTSATFSEISLP